MRAGTPFLYICAVALAACGQSRRERAETPRDDADSPPPVIAATPDDAAPPAPTQVPAAGDPTLGAPPADLAARLALRPVMRGFDRPVALEVAPGDTSGRMYVVEQRGRIWVVEGGKKVGAPMLDLRGKLARGNEQGLLGLVFHPDFAHNHKLYVDYTDRDGKTHVVEHKVDASGRALVAGSARELFSIAQPFSNHNAGDLQFAPDGTLWVGLGDGGAGGDPMSNGQNPKALLASMLRIDVDTPGAKPEIVLKGLRNPWRYSFDAKTGDLYIGDVGQDKWEEVDVIPAGVTGLNLGWNRMEGFHCYKPARDCDRTGLTLPVVEYSHKDGCSVTGGHVYRGKAIPALDGVYFYADYCPPSRINSFRWSKDTGVRDHWSWTKSLNPNGTIAEVSSFGVDAAGELYVVSLRGTIYQLIAH